MGGAAYKPFGEYYYTTSSCHAAIQKVHQYDSIPKLLSRDYGEYGWQDYPDFTGPLPVPHSASSDEERVMLPLHLIPDLLFTDKHGFSGILIY